MMAKECATTHTPHLLGKEYPTMNESFFQIFMNE